MKGEINFSEQTVHPPPIQNKIIIMLQLRCWNTKIFGVIAEFFLYIVT